MEYNYEIIPAARLAKCGNRANLFGPTVIGFISGGAVVGGEVVLLLLGEDVQGMRCNATIGWLPREDWGDSLVFEIKDSSILILSVTFSFLTSTLGDPILSSSFLISADLSSSVVDSSTFFFLSVAAEVSSVEVVSSAFFFLPPREAGSLVTSLDGVPER